MHRHTIRPVANPHRPAPDLARSKIRPLQAPERIAFVPGKIPHIPFRLLAGAGCRKLHALFRLHSLGSFAHPAHPQPFTLGTLFSVVCHGRL